MRTASSWGAQAALRLGPVEVRPTNEAQVRELVRAPASEQARVWSQVVEVSGGKPTAAAVREAVDQVLQVSPDPEGQRSRNVTFVNRVKILHGYAVYAAQERFPKRMVEKTLQWLRERL